MQELNNYEQRYDNKSGKRPEKQFNAGAVKVTIWKNEVISKDGQPSSYASVTFERTYKDKNGEWKSTSALRLNDLPKASLVLNKAYEYLAFNEV